MRSGAPARARIPRAAVPDAVAQLPIEGLAEALAEGIFVGHPDMPEFVFEADEVGAILAYLKSIQER